MAKCITCGAELHPERARKYNYCMARECQDKNVKGLTMVAVGLNKAAEEFLILDEQTREDLASGKFRDQRRGSFGPPVPAAGSSQPIARDANRAARRAGPQARPRNQTAARPAWSRSQEKLALLYNEQGLRPDEIAHKLGVTSHLATQIILAAKNRGKS